MNYYQHHIGDFNNATRHLSRVERSIYRDLLDLYYDKEAPVPTDVERTFKLVIAHSDDEKAAVRSVLAEFFDLRDDGWHQVRCDEEIEHFYTKSEQARNAGKASAQRRADKKATGVERALNETATTHNPVPITHNPVPSTQHPSKSKPLQTGKPAAPTSEVWAGYAKAYFDRYGTEPVRNGKVNGILANFLKRIPVDEAPHIAAFYVGNNSQFYVKKMHPVDLLLADAEKLRTEWVTRKQMTETAARQVDKTQANGDVWQRLIDKNVAKNANT